MKTEHWNQLTPAHQAELWPGLSPDERAEITAGEPGVLQRIGPHLVAAVTSARTDPNSRLKKPESNAAVTVCNLIAILSLIGSFFLILGGNIAFGIGSLTGAAFWWILGVIVTNVSVKK